MMTANEFVKHCQWLGQQDGPVDYKAIVHDIMAKARGVVFETQPDSDYLETHYEVVAYFYNNQENEFLLSVENDKGRGGMWELAEELTNQFHSKYDGITWGKTLDWHDTVNDFLTERIQ
jgi:hypothetical protein